MRRRNPLMDPVTDWLDQVTYPSAPGPSLPAYLADQNAPPRNQRYGHGLGAPSEFMPRPIPMVRQPIAPERFTMPPADHTSIQAGLAQVSRAMMANQENADEPGHGFAPPFSDPTLDQGQGQQAPGFYQFNDVALPSYAELARRTADFHSRGLDASISDDRGDSEINAGGFRRVQQIRRLQQQAMNAPMMQDGARPSPLGPSTMRNMLAALVQSSQAYAGEHGGTFMGMRPWARQPQRRPGQ